MNTEYIIIGLSVLFVVIVLVLQIRSFLATKAKIDLLKNFFPNSSSLDLKETSITKSILDSNSELEKFIANPPAKHEKNVTVKVEGDGSDSVETVIEEEDYSDLNLIVVKHGSNQAFDSVVRETNAYLCKNVGTSADLSLLQDICERKFESLENSITNTINVPLYMGLAGTFLGIITGLSGIALNVDALFSIGRVESTAINAAETAVETAAPVMTASDPLQNLLVGVIIAMIASLCGLVLTIWNSSVNYKDALSNSEDKKNAYYDFLRRRLMPVLSNSMASSLNSLRGVLGHFVDKFGRNLDDYADSAQLLNDNLEKQHLVLSEIQKMSVTETATAISQTFLTLKDSASSLNVFNQYQQSLNETIQKVNTSVDNIESIITRFDRFIEGLNTLVENQQAANSLQQQFEAAITEHFPTGSEARELWRKQYDALVSDAKIVTENLNGQLAASTEHIKNFVEGNKSVFDTMGKLDKVLESLISYSKVQADCYNDLKKEIEAMKEEQVSSQLKVTGLNRDLLQAVKDMTAAVRDMKAYR